MRGCLSACLVGCVVWSCSSTPAPTTAEDRDDEATSSTRGGSNGDSAMRIDGTVGAMDANAVKQSVASLNSDVRGCVQKGQKKLPFLDGDVGIRVTVDANGRAAEAFLDVSTLGDHDVELCIVKLFSSKQWPRPVGGERGEIAQSFHFDAGHMEPPDTWSPETLSSKMNADDPVAFDDLRKKLGACRDDAGTGPFTVTMYLDEDGLVRTSGLAMSDAKGEEALDCVRTTLQVTHFPAPGGNFVKASVRVD